MNLRKALFFMVLALGTMAGSSTASAASVPTVFVAPSATTSNIEYGWIGHAMAQATTSRIHRSKAVNYLSLRQVRAAIRADSIDRKTLHIPHVASRLGKLLGADFAIVSSYTAAWPNISFIVRIIEVSSAKIVTSFSSNGHLADLVAIEADIARQLKGFGHLSKLSSRPGLQGTTDLYAWRQFILGQQILSNQSLAPGHSVILPREASKTALNRFEQATNIDQHYPQAWAGKAIARALLGQHPKAIQAISTALAQGKAQMPEVVLAAYFVHRSAGDQKAALAILRQAIAEHPGFLHARSYAGELLQSQKKHTQALRSFERYLERVPDQPYVLARMGYSYSKLGEKTKAIELTIKAVDLLPQSPSLLVELASRYIDADKLHGAEENLRKAIQKFPQFATAYVRLGYVYLLRNKIDLAIPISHKGLVAAKDAEDAHSRAYAHLNLARAYAIKGANDKALTHLEAAIDNGLEDLDQLTSDERLGEFLQQAAVKELMAAASSKP